MKILLTNDDGIMAPGIYAAYKALKKIADVTVVAPDSERISVGHGITLSHPIFYKKVSREGQFFGYGISGTPADCVKFANSILLKSKPDLVVSGINLGQNDGCSVFYSGTVAGAREGALLGIPSIAMSLGTWTDPDFTIAALYTARVAKWAFKNNIPKKTFLNVNVPHVLQSKIKGVIFTKQCPDPIHGSFKKRTDPNLRDYYWMTGKFPTNKKDKTYDTYALEQNYVTIAPISCDSTDHSFLNAQSSLEVAI